jgi:hypothetical protein
VRRAITVLGLVLAVSASVALAQAYDSFRLGQMAEMADVPLRPGPMTQMGYDIYGMETCAVSEWVTGVIVPGKHGGVAIRDDSGYERQLTWGSANPHVVDWNGRYAIGGHTFNAEDTWWACGGAGSVIPQ